MRNFNTIFENALKNHLKLLTEEERPMYDDGEDIESFQGELDPESPDGVFDTEGLSPETYSMVDSTVEEIIKWSGELKTFVGKLVDPTNDQAVLTKLTKVSNIPEFSKAAEDVSKPLQKVYVALGTAMAAMDTLATMAKSRRDQRKQQDASSGPSGPY
jgi:hypothetical protein